MTTNANTMTTTDNTTARRAEIAKTILGQLGGNRFLVMTGARNLLALESGLAFKLPARFAKDGITHVRVVLTPADLYDVEFLKVRGTKCATVSTARGIYCDQLRATFTAATGLECTLGTMGRR